MRKREAEAGRNSVRSVEKKRENAAGLSFFAAPSTPPKSAEISLATERASVRDNARSAAGSLVPLGNETEMPEADGQRRFWAGAGRGGGPEAEEVGCAEKDPPFEPSRAAQKPALFSFSGVPFGTGVSI